MRRFFFLFVCLFTFAFSSAQAIETKKDQQIAFESILAEIKVHYGMIQYKKEIFGVDYDTLYKKYSNLIETATTLEEHEGLWPKTQRSVLSPDEFRQLMIGFSAEFQDGHTNLFRQSSDFFTTGIETASMGGRLFVVGFNPQFYVPGNTTEALKVGDEITHVDGKSVQDLAKENMLYVWLATHASRKIRALEAILEVPGRMVRSKVEGAPVTVQFKRVENGKEQLISGRFHWVNAKNLNTLASVMDLFRPRPPANKATPSPYVFGDRELRSYFKVGLQSAKLPKGSIVETGKAINAELAEKPTPPATTPSALTPVTPKPVTRLEAYTVHYKGKTFGVIRIPGYSPDSFAEVDNEYLWMAEAIEIFEHNTDALIIDQLTNGGGYVHAGVQTTRLLAGKDEFKTGQINMRLSHTFMEGMDTLGEKEVASDSMTAANPTNFTKFWLENKTAEMLKKKFEAGERWSGFVPHMGSTLESKPGEPGRIFKNGVTYTKPILFLNDGRSASCGDFVPSMLQANKRALIFGETSMGLGGPVYRNQSSMPGSEVSMRCTYGFCLRADGLPIENVGVIPDVKREIAVEDLKEGFKTYAVDALEAAVLLAAGNSAAAIDQDMEERHAKGKKDTLTAEEKAQLAQYQQDILALQAKQKGMEKLGYEEQAKQLLPIYGEILAKFTEAHSKLKSEAFEQIGFPLPELLLKQDVILASLTEKEAIVERLGQMQRIGRYSDKPVARQLLETLKKGLGSITPSFYSFTCADILSGNFGVDRRTAEAKPEAPKADEAKPIALLPASTTPPKTE